ncbi:MAG TPA: histidinol dehydrogenase [Arthrobacter sp.]|nr:histidinol dehydrogenase [Arthrobacter sp.]
MTPSDSSPESTLLRTIDFRGRTLNYAELKRAVPRAEAGFDSASASVAGIIDDVRARGFTALSELARTFDGVEQGHPRVPAAALREALEALDGSVRSALEESISRAKTFAEEQRPQDVDVDYGPGAAVRQKWIPVRRVGLYVPGGLAVYPSSVVMNAVPAIAAGVESIALASPPQKEFGGQPHPVILAAAALLGIEEVYAIGGAQAVAAFAYGVEGSGEAETLEPVDVVTGPGNVFVATAKRLVKGVVGIDAEAGATEIVVLADESAQPGLIAADLISQAEHDPAAASVLVTDSPELAGQVQAEVAARTLQTKHAGRVREALTGRQSAVILVEDMEQGSAVCDAYAAEHLEIHTRNAAEVAERIRNAGAIFIGDYSPVSLGDYCAGSNHVLPTSGTASFASGLNVTTFMRAVQLVNYDRHALGEVSDHIKNLAEAEDLPAHGEAVSARFS